MSVSEASVSPLEERRDALQSRIIAIRDKSQHNPNRIKGIDELRSQTKATSNEYHLAYAEKSIGYLELIVAFD